MIGPKASRPHWPDAVQNPSNDLTALKPWPWALERLEKSHNYWISTARPDGRPHLMIVWGVWWQDAFWFSTGPRTRKAKNIVHDPHVVIGTEKADEAVILEGTAEEIKDRSIWKQLVVRHAVLGVQVHDARLVALMQAHNVTHILTLNPGDFHRYPGITAISPTDLLGAQTPAPGQAP